MLAFRFARLPENGAAEPRYTLVARIEPPGPASGRPDDKLSEIRDSAINSAMPLPGFAGAQPGLQLLPRICRNFVAAPRDVAVEPHQDQAALIERGCLLAPWQAPPGRRPRSTPAFS
jgi:hypothetical protein